MSLAAQNLDRFAKGLIPNYALELIHARNIRNVQLVPPHDTPDNFSLAWDFWWRVATRHEQARNAHVFTYNGVRRADGENAEGILELVQSIPNRIHALEQRAIARSMSILSQSFLKLQLIGM